MTINYNRENDILQLDVEGKIDNYSYQDFQNALLRGFQESNSLILNLESVTHMSSVGLRALIIGQKTAQSKGGKLIVINADPAIKDILRVTGFDKILEIR